MLKKCVLTVLELNWNKRLGHKKTKLNICHHMLTSSTQLQNRSFHVVERTRTSSKCQKMKYARAKRAKILFSIVKYANFWGFCCRRRRGCLSSLLMYKILNDDTAPNLRNSFVRRNVDQTDYHLRNSATDLTLPKPKREFLKRSFKYSGAMLWNQLPNEAKLVESIYSFNKCIKT